VPARIDETRLSAWRAVLYAQAAVVDAAERALSAAALPPLAWYDVLTALDKADDGRLRMRELAGRVTMSRTGLVRLVDRIEAAGLLRRQAVPEDRRGAYAAITDEGRAMLARMWPVYERELLARFAAAVSLQEAVVVSAALERVAASSEDAPDRLRVGDP
jgi:DNA-binding MarR family transcriptional regulator